MSQLKTITEILEILSTSKIECDRQECWEKGNEVICYTETYAHCDKYFEREEERCLK